MGRPGAWPRARRLLSRPPPPWRAATHPLFTHSPFIHSLGWPPTCRGLPSETMASHPATATLAVLVLNAGAASASGGRSSGAWPAAFPLPTNPGTLLSQGSTTAVVRSTDPMGVVQAKLDVLYITKEGVHPEGSGRTGRGLPLLPPHDQQVRRGPLYFRSSRPQGYRSFCLADQRLLLPRLTGRRPRAITPWTASPLEPLNGRPRAR